MSMTANILIDDQDIRDFSTYIRDVGRRLSREELLPIMLENFAPVVAQEKSFLASGHSISGALEMSLRERSGGGDRPGVMSVFSAPTATARQLTRTWRGKKARKQQTQWGINTGRRTSIFYGEIVARGHRIVKRNAAGELYDAGKRADPVPFAEQAMDAKGDAQAELAAQAMLDHIVGK